ncbi:MAG: RRXRR domain-containing protein [Alphaproteobacteria bacterium]|nr:RRXRR domain-containing protein [Alphaproteobacteria bacterium]
MSVCVLDKRHKPLMPDSENRAWLLLRRKKAVKIGPGVGVTGAAIVRETVAGQAVLHLSEIAHKGRLVRQRLEQRAAYRRRRRGAVLQYCRVLHHAEGYFYAVRDKKGSASSPCLKAGVCALSA